MLAARPLYNLLLDFMNPESRRIAGLYNNSTAKWHRLYLERLLNLHALWCGEYCILQSGVLFECHIAEAAMRNKSSFLSSRTIRVPLGELEVWRFLENRRRELSRFSQYYPDLFAEKNDLLLLRTPEAIIPKFRRTGAALADQWEAFPDLQNSYPMPVWTDARTAEILTAASKIPNDIIRRGDTLTWPDLKLEIERRRLEISGEVLQRWNQHLYLESYNQQFALRVITSLPAQLPELGYVGKDLAYDHDAIFGVLNLWGLGARIEGLEDYEILGMRQGPGFYKFRLAFDKIAASASSVTEVKAAFAKIHNELGREVNLSVRALLGQASPGEFLRVADDLDDVFGEIAAASKHVDLGVGTLGKRLGGRHGMTSGQVKCVIFAALEFEAKALADRWSFRAAKGGSYWEGEVKGSRAVLISPHKMGRVPAAIETIKFLKDHGRELDSSILFFVVGLCGGIAANEIVRGDVVIGDEIYDLSSRKMKGHSFSQTELRPRTFRCDPRLGRLVKRTAFDEMQWAVKARASEGWQSKDRQFPLLRVGNVVCVDEVVSSDEWIAALRQVEPKALAIEMESGGVAAALEEFDLRPTVVRGVSDLADPSKADDAWRGIAIRTVANLIESIDMKECLAMHR
jgi:nucleoside phosphorylase